MTCRLALLLSFLWVASHPLLADKPQDSSEKPIRFAIGVAEKEPTEKTRFMLRESIEAFPAVAFMTMPLERSYRQFANREVDCVVADQSWAQDDTLLGPRIFELRYAFYRLKSAEPVPLEKAVVGRLLISATEPWIAERLPGLTLITAPNNGLLAALLRQRRIDYVLATDVAFGRLEPVTGGIIILAEEIDFVQSVDLNLMCHPGRGHEDFVDRFAAKAQQWRQQGLLP